MSALSNSPTPATGSPGAQRATSQTGESKTSHSRRHVSAKSQVILAGLDLSLTATGAVAVPANCDGQWRRVHSALIGDKLTRHATTAERAHRTQRLADRITGFCKGHGVTQAWIESPAFGMRTSQHSLGELHGVVKVTLLASGIDVQVAQMGSLRKLLLGNVPRQFAKTAVQAALIAAGAPASWSADEFDAMAVANWALSEAGGYCLAQAEAA